LGKVVSKKNPLVDYENPQCWWTFKSIGDIVHERVKMPGKKKKKRVSYTELDARIRGIGFVKKYRNGVCTVELAYSKKRYEIPAGQLTTVENALRRASLSWQKGGLRWTKRATKDYKQLLKDGWKFEQ
jgi:hypothetical protein